MSICAELNGEGSGSLGCCIEEVCGPQNLPRYPHSHPERQRHVIRTQHLSVISTPLIHQVGVMGAAALRMRMRMRREFWQHHQLPYRIWM